MGKPNAARSFLEQLADYDNPAPRDLDPEKHHADQYGTDPESDEDEGSHQEEARNHYTDVGKSKLRIPDGIDLGPRYSGANVSRIALQDGGIDNEEDEPFGSHGRREKTDDKSEREEEEGVIGSYGGGSDDDDIEREEDKDRANTKAFLSTSSISSEEDQDDDGDDSESNSSSSSPPEVDRVVLRKMMVEEQKSVAASLSATAKADIAKGKAIKHQRSTFDSLLNARIKLQKALIATNSMNVAPESSNSDSASMVMDCASASRAAENAALNLLDSITALRSRIYPNPNEPRRVLPSTTETSSQALWNRATYFDGEAGTRRRATLTKWSQRTNPVTAPRPQNRFLHTTSQQPLTSVIDQQLAGESMKRAIKRTRVARSCAPLQAASKVAVEDEEIYDDADFYSLLLRELVDRRMADTQSDSTTAPTPDMANIVPSRAELKVKKQVDTKASKGRKMRYAVHEKLQNFMAAEDRGSWGERQRAELFGSLLGSKVEMGEVGGNDEEMEDYGVEVGAGGLKLFVRSSA